MKRGEKTYINTLRDLNNYKKLHEKTAEARGVSRQFQSAETLTRARKILFGLKRGNTPLSKR